MPRRRKAPKPTARRHRQVPVKAPTPLESLKLHASQLLQKLLELSIADPDVEREFARLVELEFSRLDIPPPPIDIGDDIDTIVKGVVKHLYEYRHLVLARGEPTSQHEEEEYLEMVALNAIIDAAEIVIKWYSPTRMIAEPPKMIPEE